MSCSNQSKPIQSDEITEKIEQGIHVVAIELNFHHQIVLNRLQNTRYKTKLDVWVTHELSVKNKVNRLNICEMPLKRYEIEPFL